MSAELEKYREPYRRIIEDFDTRNEVRICVEPGDEVALITARLAIADNVVGSEGIPLLEFALGLRRGTDFEWLSAEVTGLQLKQPSGGKLRLERRSSSISVFFLPPQDWLNSDGVELSMELWEAVQPAKGTEPYGYSEAVISICLLSDPLGKLLLIIDTPSSAVPRSTQGNYTLAYPSRTFQGRRRTPLYYRGKGPAHLFYRFGTSEQQDSLWVMILRSTLAVALVGILAKLPAGGDKSQRLLALISALVGFAIYINDYVGRALRMEIYRPSLRGLNLMGLVCAVLVVTLYTWEVREIWITPPGEALSTILQTVSVLALCSFLSATLLVALLQAQGAFYSFRCDGSGCKRRILIRRGLRECKYTGRVPCRRCAHEMCGDCVHGADLATGELTSLERYDPDKLPCVRTLQ